MKSTAKVVVFFLIVQFLAGCEKSVSPKRPAGIAENAGLAGRQAMAGIGSHVNSTMKCSDVLPISMGKEATPHRII